MRRGERLEEAERAQAFLLTGWRSHGRMTRWLPIAARSRGEPTRPTRWSRPCATTARRCAPRPPVVRRADPHPSECSVEGWPGAASRRAELLESPCEARQP